MVDVYQSVGNRVGLYSSRAELSRIKFPKDLSGKSFLDVGCAEGFFCFEAYNRGSRRIVGIDLKPERISRARKRCAEVGKNIIFMVIDLFSARNLGEFDLVLFLSVLHHIPFGKQRLAMRYLYDLCAWKLIAEIPTHHENKIIGGKYLISREYFEAISGGAGWKKTRMVGTNKAKNRLVYHLIK